MARKGAATFEGTPHKDTNDAAWHLCAPAGSTEFIGRAA